MGYYVISWELPLGFKMKNQETKELFKSKASGLIRNYPKLLGREYKESIQSIIDFFTSIYAMWKNIMQFFGVLALPFVAPLILLFMYYKCWRSTMNDFNKKGGSGYNSPYSNKHG